VAEQILVRVLTNGVRTSADIAEPGKNTGLAPLQRQCCMTKYARTFEHGRKIRLGRLILLSKAAWL